MNSNNVEIKVSTTYLGQADGKQSTLVNVFNYTVEITNAGSEDIKLLSRYWLITNGDGEKVEVQGEGVVGKQPTIPPGKTFSYTSSSMIKTEVGTMQGFYDFETIDKHQFKATIPVFTLAVPNKLH